MFLLSERLKSLPQYEHRCTRSSVEDLRPDADGFVDCPADGLGEPSFRSVDSELSEYMVSLLIYPCITAAARNLIALLQQIAGSQHQTLGL